jgi:hypothetical protein
MYKETWVHLILRVLKNSLLIAAGIASAVFIVCWLLGWRTPFLIGQGMLFAGLGCVGLGLMSTLGTWNIRGNFGYQFSRSASHQKIDERLGQDIQDLYRSNSFMVLTLVAGMLVLLLGLLLQTFQA